METRADGLRTCRGFLVGALIGLLLLFVCGLLAFVAVADGGCPEPQVRYDIQQGVYVYGENPDINDFGVTIEGAGSITWTVKPGCAVTCARIEDDGFHWLPWAQEGSWQGGVFADFWGGCQVPGPVPEECELPPRSWVPLLIKSEDAIPPF